MRYSPPLRVAEHGRHLVDQDGKPFFYFADTAWNGALKATEEEWERYLAKRAAQGFTAIQLVLTHWRGADQPLHGRIYDEVDGEVVENAEALARMDAYLELIVAHGMLPAPVMFWVNNPEPMIEGVPGGGGSVITNPRFHEPAMIEIGRRMVARWQKHGPLWLLGGDGDYRGRAFAEVFRRVGRAVFHDVPEALVTMHSCGATWVGDAFAEEPWYTVASIQSGHGSNDHDVAFLTQGPYTCRWEALRRPFLNIEPNYEGATSFHNDVVLTPFYVRRASWWSLLGAPMAGITYGNNGVWSWLSEAGEESEGHGYFWSGTSWEDCLELEGVRHLQTMRAILEELPWTEYLPADHLLREQPGFGNPNETIKVAATEPLGEILAYTPTGKAISLCLPHYAEDLTVTWINPRTGQAHPARFDPEPDAPTYPAPTREDWLLRVVVG